MSFNVKVANVWTNSCNKTAVTSLLQNVLPAPYASLFPDIQKAVNIAEEFILSPSVPSCEGKKRFEFIT